MLRKEYFLEWHESQHLCKSKYDSQTVKVINISENLKNLKNFGLKLKHGLKGGCSVYLSDEAEMNLALLK